jgi:hypothetical protein
MSEEQIHFLDENRNENFKKVFMKHIKERQSSINV